MDFKKIKLLLVSFIFISSILGQGNNVQPTVVVVPFTVTGQDALSLYETKFEYRAIINEINNAINNRGGFMPQDLQEVISRIKENSVINEISNVNSDPIKKIIDNTIADILIKAEINIFSEKGLNSVQITLKAIDKASSKTMYASPLLTSPNFNTTDYAYLAKRVLNEGDAIGNFCNGVSNAFQNIAKNGRSIQVIFETNESSTSKLDDEDKDLNTIGDLIIDFVKKSSFNGYYKIRTQTSNQIYFEDVRIPLKSTDGSTYDINLYGRELRKALSDIYLKIKGGERVKIATPIIANGIIRIFIP